MDTMAERLAEALRLRGMKPRDLIDATKLSRGTVYFILDGTTKAAKVRAETVEAICRVLRIRREWLLYGRGAMDAGVVSLPGSSSPPDSLHVVRTAQLLMARVLAESIPTAGRALVADLDRAPPQLRESEHFALLIATLRRELAKQDAASLDTPAPKAPKRRSR
jgi:DNA-binding Xre family transcriptional regulator